MSGESRGFLAGVLRTLLWCLSLLYGLAVQVRLLEYRTGIRGTYSADVPVLCIGNITTGGTGKTPFVIHVAELLRERGIQSGILSRGYGSDDSGTNDEAKVIAEAIPEITHIQDPDRVSGARRLAKLGVDGVILDDGFSHVRLRRDANIVLIDALNPFGFGSLLPRGLLREPLSSLTRATACVITRSDQVGEDDLVAIEQRLKRNGLKESVIWRAIHVPTRLEPVATFREGGEEFKLETLRGLSVGMLSGIGNPGAFAATLADLDAAVSFRRDLPDHFAFNAAWVTEHWHRIESDARDAGCEMLIVTQKDAVKLRGRLQDTTLPVAALVIEMRLTRGAQALDNMLKELWPAEHRSS